MPLMDSPREKESECEDPIPVDEYTGPMTRSRARSAGKKPVIVEPPKKTRKVAPAPAPAPAAVSMASRIPAYRPGVRPTREEVARYEKEESCCAGTGGGDCSGVGYCIGAVLYCICGALGGIS